jgi:phytoene dehydrogenase-like protein
MSARTAIVVGAGPAGLAAANHLLDAGFGVIVLEGRARVGGRASSSVTGGFILNEGPHALYLGGAARRELKALGLTAPGALPRAYAPAVVRDGRARHMPLRGVTRLTARLLRARPAELADRTALDWAGNDELARAFLHVATYTGPLDRLSADAAVAQARSALHGVRYLHGGWQALADALADRARGRGADVRCGAAVRSLDREGNGWTASTDAGEVAGDVVIVAAGGPERAAKLLGVEIDAPGPAVEASVLDIGLDRLPRRLRAFATGLDAPRYFSMHGPPARVAPHGAVLASAASYGRATREQLEAFVDAVQPGWRERATMTRFLPGMTTITAIPTPERGGLAGRPGPTVAGAPGAYVAGDWVGPEGLLLDAVMASAAAAAKAALSAPRRSFAAA